MHLPVAVVVLLLAVAFSRHGVDGKSCKTVCPLEERPVCATFYRKNGAGFISCTFGNICKLNARECMAQEKWLSRPGRCDKVNPSCDAMTAGLPVKGPQAKEKIESTTSKFSLRNWFGKKN